MKIRDSVIEQEQNISSKSKRRKKHKVLRVILDVTAYKRACEDEMPFVQVNLVGYDVPEVIVATPVVGSGNLYVVVLRWPCEYPCGRLQLGMIGLDGIEASPTVHAVEVKHCCVLYLSWTGVMIRTVEGNANTDVHAAMFFHKHPPEISAVLVVGSSNDLSTWGKTKYNGSALQHRAVLRAGITVNIIVPKTAHDAPEDVEFKLLGTNEGGMCCEGPLDRHKKVQIPHDKDVVIWSEWEDDGCKAQATTVNTIELAEVTDPRYLNPGERVDFVRHELQLCFNIQSRCRVLEPIQITRSTPISESASYKPPFSSGDATIHSIDAKKSESCTTSNNGTRNSEPNSAEWVAVLAKKFASRKSHMTKNPSHVTKSANGCSCDAVGLFCMYQKIY